MTNIRWVSLRRCIEGSLALDAADLLPARKRSKTDSGRQFFRWLAPVARQWIARQAPKHEAVVELHSSKSMPKYRCSAGQSVDAVGACGHPDKVTALSGAAKRSQAIKTKQGKLKSGNRRLRKRVTATKQLKSAAGIVRKLDKAPRVQR